MQINSTLSLDGLTGVGKSVQTSMSTNQRPPLPQGEGWGEGEKVQYLPHLDQDRSIDDAERETQPGGKGVVITGGGTGLGREMTLAMARAGADLVITSRRVGPIEEIASEVRDLGRKAVAISTDVTDTAQVNSLMESAISELGRVDVLLNNAGIVRGQGAMPIWDISDEDWRLGIDTNMSSAFYCARAIAKHMSSAAAER